MTLLIALMLNALFQHITGEPFCHPGWIVALWFVRLFFVGNKA